MPAPLMSAAFIGKGRRSRADRTACGHIVFDSASMGLRCYRPIHPKGPIISGDGTQPPVRKEGVYGRHDAIH